jgi:peptidoglycan/xylan/chitin deacetylase (PgdA/CDA1 family)
VGLLTPAGGGARAAAPAPGGRPRLLRAQLAQAGRELVFSVRTSAPVPLATLEAQPDTRRAASRYLCLALGAPAGGANERRLCLGGGSQAKRRAGLTVVDASGKPLRQSSVPAKVTRPEPQKLVLALVPREAGLSPQRYGWRALLGGGCEVRRQCAQQLPAEPAPARVFRLRPVRAVGCTGGSAGLVTNGPRQRPVVALTFDDGPSEYTPRFLDVLREKDVPATFFEIGQEMPGREEVMRQILAEGDEIGDHTMNHVEYPGYQQIAGAAARIRQYTHFQPCLFRPPGGALNESVIATAGSLGMRTITWDVDPRDWSLPGTGAIYSNIVSHARNGSIILMHDGGGPRDETLAALPAVIDTLRARGFGFATVSELLGYRPIYRPYG